MLGWRHEANQGETPTAPGPPLIPAHWQDMFKRALVADLQDRKEKKGLSVFTNAQQWGSPKWEKVMTKKGRDESTVVLEGDRKQSILADAQEFLNSKQWYAERGIPHRRGYLLYGPPGTGKTTATLTRCNSPP
jgi:chaperone BCS1